MVNKLEIYYKKKLLSFTKAPYVGIFGAVFEHISHRTLLNGEIFKIHPLSDSMDNTNLIMTKKEKLEFINVNDIRTDKYCIPIEKNFICNISVIVSPNMFFLMVISEEFLINMKDLDKLIENFIDKLDAYYCREFIFE